MATLVGIATDSFAGAAAGDLTPDFSGVDWVEGDFALAYLFINDDNPAQVITPPTGWNFERQNWDNTAGDQRGMGLFWKVLESGDDETPSWVCSTTDARSIVLGIFNGVDPEFPFDALETPPLLIVNDVNPTPPDYVTTVADALGLLWLAMTQATLTASGAPTGYTLIESNPGETNRQQLLASKEIATPGTETPGDWTNTFSGPGNTEDSMQIAAALRPLDSPADLPIIEEQVPTMFAANATNHNVAMPASVPAGRLLVLFAGFDGTPTITNPAGGWTRIDPGGVGGSSRHIMTYKVADGSEGGTTVNVVTSVSETGGALVWMIDNWDPAEVPEFNDTTLADPPSLTASWGSGPNAWFSGGVIGISTTEGALGIAAPAGFHHMFASLRDGVSPPGDMQVQTARWASDSDTLDPTAWNGGSYSASWTMVIKGATGGGGATLNGVVFTPATTFPTGLVIPDQVLGGATFSPATSWPQGALAFEDVTLAGAVFAPGTTWPQGTVNLEDMLQGVVFVASPAFPQGVVAGGAVSEFAGWGIPI